MDYSKLSDNDLKALYNNDYSSMSDEGLQALYSDNQAPQIEKPAGIDLTPSGLVKQGLATAVAPIRGAIHKEDYKTARENALKAVENFKPAGGAGDFLVDLAAYSQLPILRGGGLVNAVGNAAIQGGVPMALESLKHGQNPLGGLAGGTALGGAIQSLPYVGKIPLVNKIGKKGREIIENIYTNAYPGISSKAVKQIIKPNSKALELNNDTAQNLLMDTTERVQKDYKNLLDNAGLEVQKAALNLPEERGVFASSLKNSLDDIYNGYSTSGIQELNPAFNNAGDIYDDISRLIEAGTDETGTKVSAKNLNDIMGNLKNYPIDWSKTSAKDRQSILKQIYSDYARRLGNLSPELRKANKVYKRIADFQNNEGLRSVINPNVIRGENIDSASRALKNYNSTVTKGNTNRNIQDLEQLLVNNGKQPFLGDIDDVNAALELLNTEKTGINPFGLLDKGKTYIERPLLWINRGINQAKEKINLSPLAERLLTPTAVKTVSPILYGGVSYNDY